MQQTTKHSSLATPLRIAIIGRPNVGKSTLFNRLTGSHHALTDNAPGVTRDWREGKGNIADLEFTVLDTAGLEEANPDTLAGRMTRQTETALARADLALMVIDGRAGVTPQDEHFARKLRKSGKPCILLVNKAEGKAADTAVAEAHRLGLGEPVPFSAEHGEGLGELYEAITKIQEEKEALDKKTPVPTSPNSELRTPNSPLRIAILGRPNAGKSTLMNALLGEERVLTGPEAGITRDAIAADYAHKGRAVKLIDTAGLRKKSNVTAKVEKLAVADALREIKFAHVVVLLLDAGAALEKQDLTLADLVEREGRALVIAVNKWDTVDDAEGLQKALAARLAKTLPQVKGTPLVPLSALHRKGLYKLMDAALAAYESWNAEFSTSKLNRWLEAALAEHSPPIVKGKRIKLRYITQKSSRPPSFIVFSNAAAVPESYTRYLTNSLREHFGLPGVPVRITYRRGENPYA